MRESRLLSILLRLQAQGRVSAPALARALEVSVRTIYRDIDALSAAGVPVYAEKGSQGGFALRDGYRTQLTGLDRPEAEALLLAGAPLAASQLGLGRALASTRLKLLAALPPDASRDAQRVAERFHLDPVAWFQGPDEQQRLPELAAAVWHGRRLAMRYDSWKGEVQRCVSPLGLVLKAGLWYLVAVSDDRPGQPRTYRVGSVMSLTVVDGPVQVPPGFDLAAHWQGFVQDYEARMQAGQARVRVRPQALRRLARISAAMARAVATAPPAGRDGWHRLTIPIESLDAAADDLLRLGPDVQAMRPAALRRLIRLRLAALQQAYGLPPAST